MGVADFIYFSIGKIKEEEIKFFLRMLEDWRFYRWENQRPRAGLVNQLARGLGDLLRWLRTQEGLPLLTLIQCSFYFTTTN